MNTSVPAKVRTTATTAAAPAAEREATRSDMQQDDGWETVGAKAKKGLHQQKQRVDQRQQGRAGHKGAPPRTRNHSPVRLKPEFKQNEANKGAGPKQSGGADQGDGSRVFTQLQQYLNTGADQDYVIHTVLRLSDLARERRFRAYERSLTILDRKDATTEELRNAWKDEAPPNRQEKYAGLSSVWHLDKQEHRGRLHQLMVQWVLQGDSGQSEVEDRLQFFKFERRDEDNEFETNDHTAHKSSYRAAVADEGGGKEEAGLVQERTRLRELCLRPADPTTQLCERTEDETKVIVMILNHEIEVPKVPPFLKQSMDPSELACFADIFMALEYPLYAHLAPGQRFFYNMTKGAILMQIYAGGEAAPAQKRDIEDFKRTVSRVTLDMEARLVKVTFKGRQSAARWAGWQMPLASKPLTLIDYEGIRERAPVTHELVLLDYVSFEVEVRKGELISRDMYWVLTKKLGLRVQEMTHTATEATGVKAQQWQPDQRNRAANTFTNGCEDKGESNTQDLQDKHLQPNINEEERRQHAEGTGGDAEEEKAEASTTAQTLTILSGGEAFTSSFEDASRTGGQEAETEQKTETGSPSEWPVDVEMAEAAEETTQPEELAAAVAAGKETKDETRSCRRVLQRGRSPTARAPRSPSNRTKLQAEFRQSSQAAERKMGTAEWKAESNEARLNMVAGRAKGKGVRLRKISLSPKRKAAPHWVTDRTQDMAEDILERTDNARHAGVVRSLSPKRRTTESARRGEKMTTQKFIHQYMQASTGNPDSEEEKTPVQPQGVRNGETEVQEQQGWTDDNGTTNAGGKCSTHTEKKAEEDCHITHVTPPTDNGAPLAEWLEVLKATTVEVAANGHCGWLAFYAALYNLNMGLVNISNEVAEGANILKKRVLNSMFANIVEEMQLHPQELTIELNASGYHQEANGSYEEQICALVNHLVAQRDKSVKAKIPMHFWVRPAHTKTMAQFARETIYVLDVHEDGQAWIQAYAYNEVIDAKGKPVEIGTVCTAPTIQAKALLHDLVEAGITPPCHGAEVE
ncbi:hypothetical protein PF004_g24099 [Phytophthora fragariae]|uniref:OTU domain-containing protein n=2 Tax=Phytophthora fragariae TaxID=53985 RepID=A0A6G0MV61_9STRA|nr:hypothetical protein PF004_g24099 [Phytophthora fragariae]